jgi:hypothetical protein
MAALGLPGRGSGARCRASDAGGQGSGGRGQVIPSDHPLRGQYEKETRRMGLGPC